jgi:hypothetical protein
MVPRILPFLVAFVITVIVMSAFEFFMGEHAHLENQLTVYAPGHAREARIALLEAHLPHIRDVDERSGDRVSLGATAALSAVFLAATLLVFGGSLAVARRLVCRTPPI